MACEALVLVVVLKHGHEERGRVRIQAGSGVHLRVGRRVVGEGFRIPVPGMGEFEELGLFVHRQGSRSPEISPWYILRPGLSEVNVSFKNTNHERAWHPAVGFPGDWCVLRADDAGKITIGEFTIEFEHESFPPPALTAPSDSTTT